MNDWGAKGASWKDRQQDCLLFCVNMQGVSVSSILAQIAGEFWTNFTDQICYKYDVAAADMGRRSN